MNIELWKPYESKKLSDEWDALLFNDELFENKFWNENFNVLVFFDDQKNNNYWYVEYNNKDNKIDDVAKIFMINKNLLLKYIDFRNDKKILGSNEIKNNLNQLKKGMFTLPPNFSILKVFEGEDVYNEICTSVESIYMGDKKYKQLINDIVESKIDLGRELEYKTNSFFSNKNKINSRWVTNRYNNGINFCVKFLEKYFPNEIEKFSKFQKIDPSENNKIWDIEFENLDYNKFQEYNRKIRIEKGLEK